MCLTASFRLSYMDLPILQPKWVIFPLTFAASVLNVAGSNKEGTGLPRIARDEKIIGKAIAERMDREFFDTWTVVAVHA